MSHHSWRILVVDDSAAIRGWAVHALGPRGYVIATASTFAETERALDTFKPDAVLLDLDMPDNLALRTAQRIRSGGSRPSIIVHSALEAKAIIDAAAALGAAGILRKGAPLDRIDQVIERCLSVGRLLERPPAP